MAKFIKLTNDDRHYPDFFERNILVNIEQINDVRQGSQNTLINYNNDREALVKESAEQIEAKIMQAQQPYLAVCAHCSEKFTLNEYQIEQVNQHVPEAKIREAQGER